MFSFEKTRRLLKKADYDYVFDKPKKIVNSHFVLLYRKNNLGLTRLGLAISKKSVAKAHDRNRIKRLIRECFRQTQLPSFDLIFLARSDVAKESNASVIKDLSKLWVKLTNCSNT